MRYNFSYYQAIPATDLPQLIEACSWINLPFKKNEIEIRKYTENNDILTVIIMYNDQKQLFAMAAFFGTFIERRNTAKKEKPTYENH